MSNSVFDENVLVAANGRETHADATCVEAAIDSLLLAQGTGQVVFSYAFLAKYANHCSHAGAPGVGDMFFVWLRDNAGSLPSVEIAFDHDGSPVGFPSDGPLAAFDFDDRVWVAGVLAFAGEAHIVNALDSDYRIFAAALTSAGVSVTELCAHQLK